MDVSAEDLRVRMASLSSNELRHIADAPEGEFTATAVEIANAELAKRPNASVETADISAAQRDRPVSSKLRALGVLVLVWIAWPFFLMSFILLLSRTAEGALLAVCAGGVGGILVWAARRISPAWQRLMVVLPMLFGTVSLVRGFFAESPDLFLNGAFMIVAGGLAGLIPWLRSRVRALAQWTGR